MVVSIQQEMLKYFVIKLPDSNNQVEIVPENWIESDGDEVNVPPDFPNEDIAQEAPEPGYDWQTSRCIVEAETSKFLKIYIHTSADVLSV